MPILATTRVLGCDRQFWFGISESELHEKLECPDVIKIDGAMVRNARGKESGEFEEMVSSARQLGWLVVVEGVECEEDLRMAERSGAEWVQGHYLSTPKLLG
ncbi:EAL domain-containing protein [Herbaspirillum sp. B65]|uniref:EAL domain-containing protein n=1 Tax=Herbaspirillum sp. B65 TaxID=137708 RepID=UPI0020907DF7|nr:EAL domain-containing protein [Herbaspirillum sp. B65]